MNVLFEYNHNCFYIHHSFDEKPRSDDFYMHAHDMNELYYFISGEGSFYVEGNKYELSPGCLMLMRPGETHRLNILPCSPYERIAMHFSPSFIISADPELKLLKPFNSRSLGKYNCYNRQEFNHVLVASCLESISSQMKNSVYNDEYHTKLLLLSHILPVLNNIQMCFYSKEPSFKNVHSNDIISCVIAYINNHLTDEWNLDTLTNRFYISKSHLNNQFKKVTGTTVWEYTLIKRLTAARVRIRNGISVMEAFRNSGFSDYSSFYRMYRKKYGVAPSEDKYL